MKSLWALYLKYKEVILYLVFGGLTTLTNIGAYALFARVFHMNLMAANGLALALSILFAYVTNKLFVFESKTDSWGAVLQEFASFMACRLATAVLDMFLMYITVSVAGLYDLLMKVIVNIIVIVLNFVFSKLIIFKKK
ncbi:MAG: GtrA family protein [Lachnospiraceae bacterium]|jgi:Predicted membrane protein|nr:GtrA family protein [Lachnospiraceae bacterium]RKI29171.1 GtrA family protein [bacterium D16-36]RKI70457.1 GtrA family protein [bacterium 1xD8-6]